MKPLADGLAPGKLFAKGVPTMVGFDDDVYLLDAFQVGGPLISPVAGARDAQGRYLVEPERVAIALPIERIESLCPLRFRVPLGHGVHALEVLR